MYFLFFFLCVLCVVRAIPSPPQIPVAPVPKFGYVQPCGKFLCVDDLKFTVRSVNYFPAYEEAFKIHWLEPGYYLRNTVEADLAYMASNYVNTLVIQAIVAWVPLTPQYIANLLDFLDLAKSYNMHVILFSDGCNPFAPVPEMCELFIQEYNISARTEVLGYDIQWEAHLGDATEREPFAPHYQSWLLDRFDGEEAVTTCYGDFPTPSNDTELCNSSYDPQVSTFRRFVDDFSGYLYMLQTQKMRQADPYHIIGFRNGYGGNGYVGVCPQFPLDLRTSARVVDYIAPEAYAFQVAGPDIPSMLGRAGFTVSYGDVGKPVILMEFGFTTLCQSCTQEQQEALYSEEVQYYTNLTYVVQHKGFSGLSNWWLVGQRPKSSADTEVSDFGLLYDYDMYPTAVDVLGNPTRAAWLQLCVGGNISETLVLAVTHDDVTNQDYACPPNTSPLGTFKPEDGGSNSSISGVGYDGRNIYSGWMALCGDSNDPSGFYIAENGTTKFECPPSTSFAGSFMPQVSPTGQATAVGRDGKSISDGWVMLCLSATFSPSSSGLFTEVNMLAPAIKRQCASLDFYGSFVPTSAPLYKPAAATYSNFFEDYSVEPKDYQDYIEVDRDAAAGDYVMYTTGTQAYLDKGSSNSIGVTTPCTGATSASSLLCVGNTNCGQCPPKCLNAEFDGIWIWDAKSSDWVVVDAVPGETVFNITLPAAVPLIVAAQVGNTGEATWLASSLPNGTVHFGCNENRGKVACRQAISTNVSWLQTINIPPFEVLDSVPSEPFSLVFQMVSEGVAWFGPSMSVVITPQ